LERYGFKHVGEMPFTEATRLITRLSANAWRMPDDLADRIKNQRSKQ
jgi:HD-like signal output (HDOD) protein